MKLIRLHIILLMLFLSLSAWTQQDAQLSQQYQSRININPAATGTANYANAFLFARQQWIGFEDAPSTQMFNAHGYLKDIRSGVGMSVLNDIIGRNHYLNLMFSYAYHIKTGEEKFLSLGLGAGLAHRKFGGDILVGMPESDPEIIEILNGKSIYRPDVNFGLMYSTPKFAFGLSATHLTHYLYQDWWFRLPIHIYSFIEFGIGDKEKIMFTPRIQAMSAFSSADTVILIMDRMDMLVDVGGTISIRDRLWFGGAFRVASFNPFGGTSFTAMAGINLTPDLRVGYSYDHKLGKTFHNIKNYGTHEIMLNYRLKIAEVEVSEATPRFFE
jgi:type IX secretion system PorP/SprF family membrane protein